jgi:nucleotide-binding universal stress UspA family protein
METKEKRPILIPWDFTHKAEFALEHAVNLNKALNTDIFLLHIAKKEKDVKTANATFDKEIPNLEKKYAAKIKVIVEVGNIFTTISDRATEMKAEMVIMGTHGMKGMQKLIGSWALKVIAGSKVPFIVVQAPPKSGGFERIVFPLDFRQENKEKISWIHYIGRIYHSKFFIIKQKTGDTKFLKNIQSNLHFTKKFLDNNLIKYDIATAEGKKSFAAEIIDYANDIKADLILIMTTKDINIADYVIGAHEQTIISNKHEIPVMCINPRPGKIGGGFSATGG